MIIEGGELVTIAPEHEPEPATGSVYDVFGTSADGQPSGSHPLTANCRICGGWLIKDTPGDPWRHRGSHEGLITEPAGGWLTDGW